MNYLRDLPEKMSNTYLMKKARRDRTMAEADYAEDQHNHLVMNARKRRRLAELKKQQREMVATTVEE